MRPIGVLRNPRSAGNRTARKAPTPAGALVREPEGLDAIAETLAEFREARIAALLVDGGDGTLREALSRLPEAFAGAPPPVAIAPHGNTNLVAREIGGWGGPEPAALLIGALARGRARETERPVLRVDRPSGPPLRGFMFGLGLYVEATEMARSRIAARGKAQVAMAVLGMLGRVLIGGRTGAGLRAGTSAAVTLDDGEARRERRLLLTATVLQRPLVLGLDPFWGAGEGAIRWLDVSAPAPRLALAAPRIAFGRPARWMEARGYRSGRARRLTIETAAPFILDGEAFDSSPGPLRLSSEAGLRFLAPEPRAETPLIDRRAAVAEPRLSVSQR